MVLASMVLAGMLAACGLALMWGLAEDTPSAQAASTSNGSWSFPSVPALNPAIIEVPVPYPLAAATPAGQKGGAASGQAQQAPGYILLAPIKNFAHAGRLMGKPGPEILEQNGNPIWEDPLGGPITIGGVRYEKVAMDFHAATWEGKPVLVWWEGHITPQGFGTGTWKIVDENYRTVAQVNAPPGFELDFHDIALTSRGTAYIIANKTMSLSLTCCGGPASGELYDQLIFEINVKTGRVVWRWDPLQHVPLRESYTGMPLNHGPWDPYHFNSISFGPAGAPIVSARNTWAAYWIDRRTGGVFATLGGKRSTFSFLPGARFAWQHDVLQQPSGQVSMFDDEAVPAVGKQSRGLVLSLNWTHHTASVAHEYLLPKAALAGSQGDLEPLPNGNVFIGWGQLPFFSEYSATGNLLYMGNLPGPDESYRDFRVQWTGVPSEPPALALAQTSGGTDVYASWNGATSVATWQLLAGPSTSALAAVGGPVARNGFETLLSTTNVGPYYAVQPLDGAGHVLATSAATRLPPPPAHKGTTAH
jgi:hypothetical protein